MRRILSEKNLVVVLFVMVLVIFSLAQEDTKKIERMYQNSGATSSQEAENTVTAPLSPETANNLPPVRLR